MCSEARGLPPRNSQPSTGLVEGGGCRSIASRAGGLRAPKARPPERSEAKGPASGRLRAEGASARSRRSLGGGGTAKGPDGAKPPGHYLNGGRKNRISEIRST